MTQIGILTISEKHDNEPLFIYFRQLEKKYASRVIIINPKDIKFTFSLDKKNGQKKENKYICYKNKMIKLDVILPRIDSDVALRDFLLAVNTMDYIRNHTDIAVINYTKGMLISNDKFWQGEYIASHGYRTPKTVLISSKEQIFNALREFKSYPLIVKSQFGSGGAGVAIVESERSAKSVISSMILSGNNAVIQEYLPVRGGTDYRLYVVGGKVIKGVIRRAALKDFRANVALGGSKKSFNPSRELQNVAIDIANIVGLEIAAVDFMYYKSQFYFIEINKNPGTKKDPKTTEKILAYVVERSKKKIKKIKTSNKKYTISSLENVKKIFDDLDVNIFGLGSRCFRRLIPAFFVEKYGILSYELTNDIKLLSRYARTRSIQEKDIEFINYNASVTSADNIDYASIENYLRRFSDVHLFVYARNEQIDNILKNSSYALVLANPSKVVEKYKDDIYFKQFLNRIGIKTARFENYKFARFLQLNYQDLAKKFGSPLVIDLSQETSEAGKDTFIINNESDYKRFRALITKQKYFNRQVNTLNVVKYLPGISVSLNCAVTKYGVLTGKLALNLMDLAQVSNNKSPFKGRNCGAIWEEKLLNPQVRQEANRIAIKIAKAMHRTSNYRGLFNLNFIFNPQENSLIPVECYPGTNRTSLTEDLMNLKNNLIPFDAFGYLESFKVNYFYNYEKFAKLYQSKNKCGSNLYLYNRQNKTIKLKGNIPSGIYSYNQKGNIKFLKEEVLLSKITSKNQFILVESVTSKETDIYLVDDNSQILSLIFPQSIIDRDYNLKPEIKKVVENIYRKLGIYIVFNK